MYIEPMRITFVSWPSRPMATVFHQEFDNEFDNWLYAEVEFNGAAFTHHRDFYSMWEDHIENEAYQAFIDERYCPDYRTDQERNEDSFLFHDEEDDFIDEIPF